MGDLFFREKMALRYLEQHGVKKSDPRRGDIIAAFCAGLSLNDEKPGLLRAAEIAKAIEYETWSKVGNPMQKEPDYRISKAILKEAGPLNLAEEKGDG